MRRSIALTTMTLWVGLAGASGRAEHAKIEPRRGRADRPADRLRRPDPPESGKNPRPVLKAKAGEPIKVQWIFTNVYPHKTLENVVVHFFIARQEKVGQKELPDLRGDVVLETAFDMDFKPGRQGGGRNTVRIDAPGVYLVRVESRQTRERPRALRRHRPGDRGAEPADRRPDDPLHRADCPDLAPARLDAGPSNPRAISAFESSGFPASWR